MAKTPDKPEGLKKISTNRKAYHDYFVIEKLEAGLVLRGTEVKSLRNGSVSLDEAWARPTKDGELFLMGVYIPEYVPGTWTNHETKRPRKLLLHRREIQKLISRVTIEHLTLVPLELYWKRGFCKVLLGICKGKKLHDKRQSLREKDDKRAMQRAAGRSRRGDED